ncbi:MAG TPA: hypothetical protein VGS21_04730 [Acidimicrobiales bacterium]|nr:hypothetical protein [Acidimicrobiales bacterium]
MAWLPFHRSAAIASAIVATGIAISVCLIAIGYGAGPVTTQEFGNGQPILDSGGVGARPGQSADFTAYLTNHSDVQVKFLSAALIPIPGYPTPTLAHTAIITSKNIVGSGLGWPIVPSTGFPTRPFIGGTVGRGDYNIMYGVIGTKLGTIYMSAGLIVDYEAGGQLYRVALWTGEFTCIDARPDIGVAACDAADLKITSLLAKAAGVS